MSKANRSDLLYDFAFYQGAFAEHSFCCLLCSPVLETYCKRGASLHVSLISVATKLARDPKQKRKEKR